jgi:tetratricopeptide (TPR) repeat protein
MRRRLNLKLFAALLCAFLLMGVGVHFLHAYQVRRSASGLLDQATRAEEEESFADAAKLLNHYLGYVPQDTEALARYGFALDKLSPFPPPALRLKTLLVFDQVLRLKPEKTDVRRRLVSLYMKPDVERYQEAMQHLKTLIEGTQTKAELAEFEELLGRCHAANKDPQKAEEAYTKAEEAFQKAIDHDSTRINAYVALARVLRQSKKTDAANKVMDDLVDNNPTSSGALVRRALYRKEVGPLEEAEKDLAKARDELRAADELEVLSASAEVARARKKPDEARQFLEKGVRLYPSEAAFHVLLAELDVQSGNLKEAIARLRRGLEEASEKDNLLWLLTDLLTQSPDREDREEAMEKIAEMRKSSTSPLIDFLAARILLAEKEWHEASETLEKLHPQLGKLPDFAKKADLLLDADLKLAECYGQLGDANHQYAVYKRVLALDPSSDPASRSMAAALEALGKLDDALEVYRRLGDQLAVARLRILRSNALPVKQRALELKGVDDLLAQAAKGDTVPIVTLLQAQSLAAQERYPDALQLLTAARDKKPNEVTFWTALARLREQQGQLDKVPPLLDQAEEQLGDRVELRLARASYWAAKGGPDAPGEVKRLEEGAEKLNSNDQLKLWRGLTVAYSQLGKTIEAIEVCKRVARKKSLDGWLVLFDLNLQAGDVAGMTSALKEIEEIEGPEGALGGYRKLRLLIWQAEKGDDATRKGYLDQARPVLASLAKRRPDWASVAYAEALLEDVAKNQEAAIASYQRAIELGERSPLLFKRLVQLLQERGRYPEADQAIRKLPEQALRSSDLQRFAAEASVRFKDMDRAKELAKKAVSDDSRDYRDFIWLGQILEADNPGSKEAEDAYRHAVELNETAPDAWVVLVQHLVRTEKTKQAEEVISKAQTKIPADQMPLAMAQCYELMGQIKEARDKYKAALKANPHDPSALWGAATFELRAKQPDKAEEHLWKITSLKKPDDEAKATQQEAIQQSATRLLAVLLGASGNSERSRKALELLKNGLKGQASENQSAADIRLQAFVLAARKDRQSRTDAIRLLETLGVRQPLEPDDKFMLAQLYEAAGNWGTAKPALLALVAAHPDNARYLGRVVQSLLRHDDVEGAKVWLKQLETVAKEAPATIEMQARVLHALREDAKAVDLLVNYSPTIGTKIDFVARLLEEFGQQDAAEKMYRKLAADTPTPENTLALAEYLGRRGRTNEALELWEQARNKCPLEKASLSAVAILYAGKAKGEPCRRVSEWLDQEIQKNPQAYVLLERQAAICNLEGRYPDAEFLYRQIIKHDPRNAVALNNLAWLIAWNHRETEALGLVNEAITYVGREPSLLDTRGVIYLALGQNDRALEDLQDAAAEKPTAPVIFHLARAYLALNNHARARTELDRAGAAGLQVASLHPLEHETYHKVVAAIKSK